jgi:vancomycin resistance protein YoaR
MLTHRGFKILSKKNHSTRYESYYPALINGVEISTPGLDAMVFEREQDLVFQNIRDYPLIIITSFDGVA